MRRIARPEKYQGLSLCGWNVKEPHCNSLFLVLSYSISSLQADEMWNCLLSVQGPLVKSSFRSLWIRLFHCSSFIFGSWILTTIMTIMNAHLAGQRPWRHWYLIGLQGDSGKKSRASQVKERTLFDHLEWGLHRDWTRRSHCSQLWQKCRVQCNFSAC